MAKNQGIEVFRSLGSTTVAQDDEPTRTAHLGFSATLLALGMLAVFIYAETSAVAGEASRATTLAWIAIVGSTITGVLGAIALFGGFGRRWGVAAILVSIVANPTAVIAILDLFGSLAVAP
jgi:hypothetical protein